MSIDLSKEIIDNLFIEELKEDKPYQGHILVKLYKLAFKDYENIEKINGWPNIGKDTSAYLFEKFIQFDKKIHPEIFAGGLWLNNGFSWDNDMPNWVIDSSKCEIVYKVK